MDNYEKRFIRNRVISIIRKNKKRDIEMMCYFKFLRRQRGNRLIGKHIGNVNGINFRRIEEELEFYSKITDLTKLKREFIKLTDKIKKLIINNMANLIRKKELIYLADEYQK